MKKLYAILFIVALVHTGVYGQAKKPYHYGCSR